MRKVILDLAVTLDGFIEGPNGEIDWCIMEGEEASGLVDFLKGIGTILYGRVSYDLWGEYQVTDKTPPAEAKIWEAVHSKEKYVFSKDPSKSSDKAKYISGDIGAKVKAMKAEPGKDMWLYGGASLITTFINENLIDEYRLAVHPVILGAGKPLFENIKHRVNLSLKEVKSSKSSVTQLIYTAL